MGDALGAPIEFMSRQAILQQYGPNGLTRYVPAYGGLGTITDDTQMTLFTAEGLLRAYVRGSFKGITTHVGVTKQAYLRWLSTQGESVSSKFLLGDINSGWLISHPEIHHRRAPGNTCLAALAKIATQGEEVKNDRKGCGGVMRVAPVGLYGWNYFRNDGPLPVFEQASEIAAITHGHPTGHLTAGVLAVLVMGLVDGVGLKDVLPAAKACLCRYPHHEETLAAIEQAETLANKDVPPAEAIRRMGEGWVAEEALAISLYCALKAKTFREGVIMAVNHDGDSDSTGAITGNLLGAMHGVKRIPGSLLEQLELKELISEIAEDLYEFPSWWFEPGDSDDTSEKIWEKYPGY